MTVWYVDKAAAPGGDGLSPATAFQYISDAVYAVGAGAGDIINIAVGTYSDQLPVPSDQLQMSNIDSRSFVGDGMDDTIISVVGNAIEFLVNSDGNSFSDMTIHGASKAVHMNSSGSNSFTRVKFKSSTSAGIAVDLFVSSGNVFTSCEFEGVGTAKIGISFGRFCQNNIANRCILRNWSEAAIHFAGQAGGPCNYNHVLNCWIYDNTRGVKIGPESYSQNRVAGCVLFNNNIVFNHNTAGGLPNYGIQVHNNIVQDWGDVVYNIVSFETTFFSDYSMIVPQGAGSTGRLSDAVNRVTLDDWQTASQAIGMLGDPNSFETGNAQFKDVAVRDFHILEGSPAIDRGSLMTDIYAVDYDGDPRPSGITCDIGSHEIQFLAPPPSGGDDMPEFKIYPMIIKSLRAADASGDLAKYVERPESLWGEFQTRAADVQDLINPFTSRADALKYLKWMVGITSELDALVAGISESSMRKLIDAFPPMIRIKGTTLGIRDSVRSVCGFRPIFCDWFWRRAVVGDASFGSDASGPGTIIVGGAYTERDEYLTRIRLMDDGTVDRSLIRGLISLNRIISERVEIAYVDFQDWFEDDRSYWANLDGTDATIVSNSFSVPVQCREEVSTSQSTTWRDYIAKVVLKLVEAKIFGIGVYYDLPSDSAYLLAIDVLNNRTQLIHRAVLADTVFETTPWASGVLSPDSAFTATVRVMPEGSNLRLRCWLNGVLQHDYLHSAEPPTKLIKGSLTLDSRFAGAATQPAVVYGVELYQVPLAIESVTPDNP